MHNPSMRIPSMFLYPFLARVTPDIIPFKHSRSSTPILTCPFSAPKVSSTSFKKFTSYTHINILHNELMEVKFSWAFLIRRLHRSEPYVDATSSTPSYIHITSPYMYFSLYINSIIHININWENFGWIRRAVPVFFAITAMRL
ncbi:MAG: hypothetical protein Greene07147_399 [Parcubacteria group bacterium Greene0714_7]|nr:MAG: hypothetical protein Greene07147_399 [Parcubacteria group bacterium Greene0714_7]